jgi:hypothetical protein
MQPEDMFAPPQGIPAITESTVVFACAILFCAGSLFVQRMCCRRPRSYKESPLLPVLDPLVTNPSNANLKHRILPLIAHA